MTEQIKPIVLIPSGYLKMGILPLLCSDFFSAPSHLGLHKLGQAQSCSPLSKVLSVHCACVWR